MSCAVLGPGLGLAVPVVGVRRGAAQTAEAALYLASLKYAHPLLAW